VTRAVVSSVVAQAIGKLDIRYPEISPEKKEQIKVARKKLEEG
jgi:hypothetical protein